MQATNVAVSSSRSLGSLTGKWRDSGCLVDGRRAGDGGLPRAGDGRFRWLRDALGCLGRKVAELGAEHEMSWIQNLRLAGAHREVNVAGSVYIEIRASRDFRQRRASWKAVVVDLEIVVIAAFAVVSDDGDDL